jgi:ribose transport system ATP-binding protein
MTFPGQVALAGVDLALYPGTVHALVGQNGSGKSTLIKILAGFHTPDRGTACVVDGSPLEFGSAGAAHRAGLRFIHQDLALLDDLSVVDNFALSNGYRSFWWLGLRQEARHVRAALADYLPDVDVWRRVGDLSAAQKAMVAIARALDSDEPARVMVLDEPTVALHGPQVEQLFGAIRTAAAKGVAVLYVSHNLREVLDIADWVTVLRDGRVVASRSRRGADQDTLIRLIVGSELENAEPRTAEARASDGMCVIRVAGLTGAAVRDADFVVQAGEIVGVAGLDGSGRDEVTYLVAGARPRFAGQVQVNGRALKGGSPREAIKAGIAFVAADRKRQSAIPELTARENVTLPQVVAKGPLRWISTKSERADARAWMERAGAPPGRTESVLQAFSGGNQQKIVLARALRLNPRLLVMDQPMQGVDVGAKAAIYQQLSDAADSGLAVLISSSDAEELEAVCDRVLVFSDGRITAELTGDDVRESVISDWILTRGGARERFHAAG